ncbi:MAG: bifunctional adenosylcobinamide kinase/adenosylcobinamide-phosphate guanylyltransferase [Deltaproteobacteria bacterium]|nr:bifunctional adenosylcobinamide kinase/adenosylcobinamide-phosphate guanylyltransferase [Deltaproteobacteria bacterium]
MFGTAFDRGCLLVTGGAKSGKSSLALEVCDAMDKEKIFLATAQALDQEMEKRIRRHKEERTSEWRTIEEPLDVPGVLSRLDREDRVILVDCLTLWVNNLYMNHGDEQEAILSHVDRLVRTLSGVRGAVVVVSNEIGWGIVPGDPVSRAYRDTVGFVNQQVARTSSKVVVVVSGLPLVLKDG